MGVLLDSRRYAAIHSDLFQFISPRPDIVHEDLVRCHLVFDGISGVADFFELDPSPQLAQNLDP
jgi:hypothetical protein